MPLYEYQCSSCGKHYERIERVSELHDGVCPVCGGVAHRLVSAPALQFKGSGWYVTDYGKGNGSAAGAGKGEEKASSTGSTETSAGAAGSTTTAPEAAKAKSDTKVA
jgi:putative FmdB family regulatory protein